MKKTKLNIHKLLIERRYVYLNKGFCYLFASASCLTLPKKQDYVLGVW